MEEKQQGDQTHDDAFFQQLLPEHRDGSRNELRTVVSWNDRHAGRQGWFDLLKFGLHAFDHRERVFARTHDHDAADGLALAVQLRNAASLVRSDLNPGDVLDQDRRATVVRADRDQIDIVHRLEIAAPADHVFSPRHFQHASAHLGIAVSDRIDHGLDRQPIGGQRIGVHFNLVLLDESAHRCHFGHARHAFQLITQIPILQAAQLREIMPP